MTDKRIRRMAVLVLSAVSFTAYAHGDEPHGDAPHPVPMAASGAPRFEAATETFELAGRLEREGLVLFVNRFETNEPVLQAQVEVESGTLKAAAAFDAGQGRYLVDDAGFVAALRQPGDHPVIVTVLSGAEADLLDGTLNVPAPPQPSAGETRAPVVPAMAGALGAALLGAGTVVLRRRQPPKGGAQ